MKKNIGFIALGQAGGNIGTLFSDRGYDGMFINTSLEDLDTLKKAKFKYHIKDAEGANGNRDKSKELIIADAENILKEIEEKMQNEIILVIFSAGGGSGSGGGPMLTDLLRNEYPNKIILPVTVYPAEDDSLKAYINAYECYKELEQIKSKGCTFILDNNSKKDKLAINRSFVELFDSMVETLNYKSIKGNIDKSELKEMLTTEGCFIISKMGNKNASTSKLLNSIKESIFAPLENDKVIKYVWLSTSIDIDHEDIKKEFGLFIDIFQNYNTDFTMLMLAGLSYPFGSLEKMKNRIIKSKEIVQKNLQEPKNNKLEEGINFLNSSDSKIEKPAVTKFNFDKYRKK
jgi:tubulin-like protein CetZ